MPAEISGKILFVDDEINVLNSFKRVLHKKYDIHTAIGGEEAIELIKQSDPFAVVVCDLLMQGMDGLEVLSKVRKISPETVTIMLTGCADIDVAVEAVNKGRLFRFLRKPCSPELLEKTIQEAIEKYERSLAVRTYTYTTYVQDGQVSGIERSKGSLAVTGYTAKDFGQDHNLWLSFVINEFRPQIEAGIQRVIEGCEVRPLEFKIRRKDGLLRWLRDTIIPHRDAAGNVFKFDGLVEDITEEKEMEQALMKSEARYERMVANMPGVVYQIVFKTDGSIEFPFVSDSCQELFGLSPEKVIQNAHLLTDRIFPEDRAELYHQMSESSEKLTPCNWWGRADINGRTKWFQSISRPERLDTGDTIWDGIFVDMTNYKRIEEEVNLIAKFPSENPNPVLRISADNVIIYANKASDPLLELWSRKVTEKLPTEMHELIRKVRKSGSHDCIEVKCGEHIFSMVVAHIAQDDYVNLYARDITAVKKAEDDLIKTNAILKEHDRLKSEFVSTVSHEMRTPLCIFKNIISNAMAGVMGKVAPRLLESLKLADQSIDRLSRIIADFLDISKIESGTLKLNMEDISMNKLIKEVSDTVQVLAEVKAVELKCNLCPQDVTVKIDRDRIVQVLTNLIGNAVKFIQKNGCIEIILVEHSDEVEISVKDNGPGLSREDIAKIFDRFVQIEIQSGPGEHGIGLGLTIARELVEMHGGRLWVESEPSRGSCFSFSLPKKAITQDEFDGLLNSNSAAK